MLTVCLLSLPLVINLIRDQTAIEILEEHPRELKNMGKKNMGRKQNETRSNTTLIKSRRGE